MKKCPKCGKELADDAVFCNGCGEKLDAGNAAPANNDAAPASTPASTPTPAPAAGAPVPPPVNPGAVPPPMTAGPAPQAPAKNNNKTVGMIAVGAVAVIAVVIIIALLSGIVGGGCKAPVKNVVGLINRQSTDIYAYNNTVQPAAFTNAFKSIEGLMKGGDAKDDIKENIEDSFDDIWDDFEDTYGDHWKISLEFTKVERFDKDDLEDLQDQWEDELDDLEDSDYDDEDTWEYLADYLDDEKDTDFDADKAASVFEKVINKLDSMKLTAAYEVKVKVTIKGSDDKDSETFKLTVVKVGGKWIIYDNEDYYSFMSFITCGNSSIVSTPRLYYIYD